MAKQLCVHSLCCCTCVVLWIIFILSVFKHTLCQPNPNIMVIEPLSEKKVKLKFRFIKHCLERQNVFLGKFAREANFWHISCIMMSVANSSFFFHSDDISWYQHTSSNLKKMKVLESVKFWASKYPRRMGYSGKTFEILFALHFLHPLLLHFKLSRFK